MSDPVPFYHELSWYACQDKVHYELSARHPIYGRTILAEWAGLRPAGLITPQWVATAFWAGALDLMELADTLEA